MTGDKHSLNNVSFPPPIDRLLRWPDVQPFVGICRSHACNLIAQGQFPASAKLVEGGRASAWPESSACTWVERRVTASLSTGPEVAQGQG